MSAMILFVEALLGTPGSKVALGMVRVQRRLGLGSIRAIASHSWCALSLKGWVVKIPTIPRQLEIHRSSFGPPCLRRAREAECVSSGKPPAIHTSPSHRAHRHARPRRLLHIHQRRGAFSNLGLDQSTRVLDDAKGVFSRRIDEVSRSRQRTAVDARWRCERWRWRSGEDWKERSERCKAWDPRRSWKTS